MPTEFRSRPRFLGVLSSLLLLGGLLEANSAAGQRDSLHLIGAEASFYVPAGGALPALQSLNAVLRTTPFPTVGAVVPVVGMGLSVGRYSASLPLGIGLETLYLIRADGGPTAVRPETGYSAFYLGVPLHYWLVLRPTMRVRALAGPQLQVTTLDLSLPDSVHVPSFVGYVTQGSYHADDKRQLSRFSTGLLAGFQLDWLPPRRPSRASIPRRVLVGMRVQYAQPLVYGQWRAREGEGYNNTRTGAVAGGPRFNPTGASGLLVVSWLH